MRADAVRCVHTFIYQYFYRSCNGLESSHPVLLAVVPQTLELVLARFHHTWSSCSGPAPYHLVYGCFTLPRRLHNRRHRAVPNAFSPFPCDGNGGVLKRSVAFSNLTAMIRLESRTSAGILTAQKRKPRQKVETVLLAPCSRPRRPGLPGRAEMRYNSCVIMSRLIFVYA